MQCAHSVSLPARIHRDGRPAQECLCVYVDSVVDGADCAALVARGAFAEAWRLPHFLWLGTPGGAAEAQSLRTHADFLAAYNLTDADVPLLELDLASGAGLDGPAAYAHAPVTVGESTSHVGAVDMSSTPGMVTWRHEPGSWGLDASKSAISPGFRGGTRVTKKRAK